MKLTDYPDHLLVRRFRVYLCNFCCNAYAHYFEPSFKRDSVFGICRKLSNRHPEDTVMVITDLLHYPSYEWIELGYNIYKNGKIIKSASTRDYYKSMLL